MFIEPFTCALLLTFAVASVLLTIFDVRTQRMPNRVLLPILGVQLMTVTLGAVLSANHERVTTALLAGLTCFAFALTLALCYPPGLGGADVKLSALIGLVMGWFGWLHVILTGAIALLIAGLIAGVKLVRGGRNSTAGGIALAPLGFGSAWLVLAFTGVAASLHHSGAS